MMATYIYACLDCERDAFQKHADKLREVSDELRLPISIVEECILFETTHAMQPSEEELLLAKQCPRCGGTNCEKTFHGLQIHGYSRGYGWLDRKGIKRDMNLFHLKQKDPYAEYRVPGEVEHIESSLKKAGQKQANKTYSVPKKEMEQAVAQSAYKRVSE